MSLDDLIADCNDDRRRRNAINLGRCRECGRRHVVNADGLCMGCEFTSDITTAFPKAEVYHRPDGITVLDLSRVNLWRSDD